MILDNLNPLIKHLSNLKFYADYKKSPALYFDQYVEYIEKGAPENFIWIPTNGKPVIERFTYYDPLEDAKFENDVEEFLNNQRLSAIAPTMDSEEWFSYVMSAIENILKKENAYILLETNPFDTLKRLLDEHDQLREFIKVNEKDFFKYTSWMQQRPPEDFFLIFSGKSMQVRNYPLIHCYPRIFKTCKEYEFFNLLCEKLVNPQADLNFIYYQMKSDRLIFTYCKQEFQELVSEKFNREYIIYSEAKVTPNFNNSYTETYKEIY